MNININENISYYKSNGGNDCDCIYCQYFREKIKMEFNNLSSYLSKLAIDITRPFEIGLPYLNSYGKLEYPLVQYICFGSCSESLIEKIDDLELRKAQFFPSTELDKKHFVIEISPLIFDAKPSKIILNELETS